ncbi:class A beta-lactamase-related serine hydrolase [Streptomyces sp. DSM 40750]|uniref:class A beta-lactamase-related serine hydrolase n=1 Tax=Streptomyces sp. DSM 40750 TaxID=2801030 RepID=UPI00214C425F|nr:class A beta-lactamase-related serine hydrolase [Streptomyces sp. DSM 40750]UUU20791.1 class A beta-lactamase-related serine hydrolase [Streptomyces sp. DSM 40750]
MPSPRARRRAHPSVRRPLFHVALAALVLVGGTSTGTVYMRAQAHDGGSAAVSSSASSSVPPPASASTAPGADVVTEGDSVEPVAAPEVDHDELLSAALADVTAGAAADGATVSVAVMDVVSGDSAVYGDARFDTASIVKTNILAALLLQAQEADRPLTAEERTYASAMIRSSDNASATALWKAIGQADGLDAANVRFGLTGTEGGDGLYWGLTQTTAADQLALLQQVFGDDDTSELSAASRAYVQELMGRIAVDQDWGVSAAASGSSASAFALKNGWLPRTATGLWDINSVGRVTVDGQEYLVAVVSNGNTTKARGISLVEAAARAAVSLFADTEDSADATATTNAATNS